MTSSYQSKVGKTQGGEKMYVKSGGTLDIENGGKITDDGVQAAHIANLTAITGGDAPTEAEHNAVRTAVNSILAALRGVGVLATS
jgi:hypothetical protein